MNKMEQDKSQSTKQATFEQRWQERFKSFAKNNENDAGIAGWTSSGLRARVRHFVRVWQNRPVGQLWLDAGCGAGTYSRLLVESGLTVVGMDYSLPTLSKAREREKATAISWAVGDAMQLPVKNDVFDGTICFGVTQALSSSTPLVNELRRIVKPGGEIWIDALNGRCLPHWWERIIRYLTKRPPHVRYELPNEFKRLIRQAGLTNIHLYWLPILPQRLQYLQWMVETSCIRALLCYVPFLGQLLSHSFVVCARRP